MSITALTVPFAPGAERMHPTAPTLSSDQPFALREPAPVLARTAFPIAFRGGRRKVNRAPKEREVQAMFPESLGRSRLGITLGAASLLFLILSCGGNDDNEPPPGGWCSQHEWSCRNSRTLQTGCATCDTCYQKGDMDCKCCENPNYTGCDICYLKFSGPPDYWQEDEIQVGGQCGNHDSCGKCLDNHDSYTQCPIGSFAHRSD